MGSLPRHRDPGYSSARSRIWKWPQSTKSPQTLTQTCAVRRTKTKLRDKARIHVRCTSRGPHRTHPSPPNNRCSQTVFSGQRPAAAPHAAKTLRATPAKTALHKEPDSRGLRSRWQTEPGCHANRPCQRQASQRGWSPSPPMWSTHTINTCERCILENCPQIASKHLNRRLRPEHMDLSPFPLR